MLISQTAEGNQVLQLLMHKIKVILMLRFTGYIFQVLGPFNVDNGKNPWPQEDQEPLLA